MAVIRLNRATEQACVPCGPRHYLNVFIYFSTFVPSVGYTAVSLKSPCQIEGVTPASVICHQCPITTNHKTVNCKNRCLFWSRFHNSMLSLASRCVHLFATPWTAAHQASLSFTISPSLLKLMSIELVVPSSHLILCRPLLLLPSVFPSITVFSSESTHCINELVKILELQLQPSVLPMNIRG